jgi:hypothetical protein
MLADRETSAKQASAGRSKRALTIRSRASNDLGYLPGVSACSQEGRRYVDVVHDVADKLGGADKLDAEMVGLVREVGSLVVKVEGMQSALMLGQPVDDEMFIRYSNMLDRKRAKLAKLAALHQRSAPKRSTIRERLIQREAQAREAASA